MGRSKCGASSSFGRQNEPTLQNHLSFRRFGTRQPFKRLQICGWPCPSFLWRWWRWRCRIENSLSRCLNVMTMPMAIQQSRRRRFNAVVRAILWYCLLNSLLYVVKARASVGLLIRGQTVSVSEESTPFEMPFERVSYSVNPSLRFLLLCLARPFGSCD